MEQAILSETRLSIRSWNKRMTNLIDLIPNSNVKKIVLASSSEVYQTPINIPISEIASVRYQML